jgi:hypothetical protein
MTRTLAAVAYWLSAVTITLGSIGHGFFGVKPVRTALDAVTLPPEIMRVLWIVWYWVSGTMVIFGLLLFWAWPALKAGSSSRSAPPLIIGVSYMITGIVCFLYTNRDPFWLVFLTQGVVILGSMWVFTQRKALGSGLPDRGPRNAS